MSLPYSLALCRLILVNSPQIVGTEEPLTQTQRGSFQYLTANVQEEIAEDEFVGLLPTEEIESAIAQATTLTETDVGRETCQIVTATMFESLKGTPLQPRENTKLEFWNTSVGRFRFSLDQLPAQLRLIYSLLQNIESEVDPDVQYFLLSTMKYICLHCEALSNARREYRGFLIWVQENLLISKLWTLLRSDYAQVGQLAVPLLIHAITLPCGEEVFWNTVNRDFTSEKWEVRFKAVERVYVLAHMMVEAPVKANKLLQTSLSCAFSHLIVSVNDPNPAVAQRTLLALRALPTKCLNLMNLCLEAQFDSCILDRPLIISRIYLLTSVVPEENILTWEFFINRFETLAVEAQLKFQSNEQGFVQGLFLLQKQENAKNNNFEDAKKKNLIFIKTLKNFDGGDGIRTRACICTGDLKSTALDRSATPPLGASCKMLVFSRETQKFLSNKKKSISSVYNLPIF